MTRETGSPCGCGDCAAEELPVTPFESLRVAYGMLLGEDDFRVLMGNPRGQRMLEAAWLHGRGVVWGFEIVRAGEFLVEVTPGLAIDGLGRELAHGARACLDLRGWVDEHASTEDVDGCTRRTVQAVVLAGFGCQLSRPVPTLADPCDVTRNHDDASRVQETTWIEMREGPCPEPEDGYHRVRVLLGLHRAGQDDPAGEQAVQAREHVARLPEHERPKALLRAFRRLAALDCSDLRPARAPGVPGYTLFPVLEEDAAVPLACVELDLKDADGCTTIEDVRIDSTCRTALLPTATIQELVTGLAPALIGASGARDAGGPRVLADGAAWSDDGLRCYLPLSAAINPGSLRRSSIVVTSLSRRSWVDEDIDRVWYDADGPAIVIGMADRPVNPLVRVTLLGTGPTPVYGDDPPVPLAGVWGGPPGSRDEGHDAVLTFSNPLAEAESVQNGAGR